jgi:hypothetical protein
MTTNSGHRIYHFSNSATTQLQIPISFRAMMRAFGCVPDRVIHGLAHGLEPPDTRGRHLGMDDDIECRLLLWIQETPPKATL